MQHIHFDDDLIDEEKQDEDDGSDEDVAKVVGEEICRGQKGTGSPGDDLVTA